MNNDHNNGSNSRYVVLVLLFSLLFFIGLVFCSLMRVGG